MFSWTAARNAAHSGLKLGSRTRCRREIEAINRKEIVQTSPAISTGRSDSKLHSVARSRLSLKCQWVFSSSTYTDRDWLSRFASTQPESGSSDGESALQILHLDRFALNCAERAAKSILRISSCPAAPPPGVYVTKARVHKATTAGLVNHDIQRTIAQHHGSWLMSIPCSIHLRIYDGQSFSLIPRALQEARNLIASRSTNFTSAKSSFTSAGFASASRSSSNSDTCLSSIRPLRVKIARPLSSDLRIFNIAHTIVQLGNHTQSIDNNILSSFSGLTKFRNSRNSGHGVARVAKGLYSGVC